jgi:predicted DNA-binding protein (UPF0278 family)
MWQEFVMETLSESDRRVLEAREALRLGVLDSPENLDRALDRLLDEEFESALDGVLPYDDTLGD